ncbi:N(4)-(beta-N-acetylglucosaminyl)-L-asparaginase [Enterococcus saccharolyticus]|uniref:N(4)-(beta-N-acetylglucosaminyl)-L-asparaginase n=1 Tax=Enterococcus TaxID=1350 RepID=UPI001E326AE3|nr:N(4)-(beta-N-acetylglucosaminyl)-L-asparaginase [Enterococcus saccharolyticus]MCD5001910.1 N(4)-(beta-N-acetylglucosaminyl)-L-asparaginase [Enterococcus saccharolyticus]
MSYGMIATWRMAYDGIRVGIVDLANGGSSQKAIVDAIKIVEDYPFYKSVGYGGLPNEVGLVELDAAFMNGDNFDIGAVAGSRNVKNPIVVAEKLSHERFNSFLVGDGVAKYASKEGFELQNMLTERAKKTWENRLEEMSKSNLSPYDGHDTVSMVALDQHGSMSCGTSSSGLFMKKEGRTGDSPLSGSGFYVDSEIGGATATGLGEDLMKGCLSYETVRLMSTGLTPQEAVNQATMTFVKKLERRKGKCGAFSLVAMNNQGEWGVATNVEFSFVVATDRLSPTIYLAYPAEDDGYPTIEVASQEWLDAYQARITAPIK